MTFTAATLEELCRHEYANKFLILCNEDLYTWGFFERNEARLLSYFADTQFGSTNMFRVYDSDDDFSMTPDPDRDDLCTLKHKGVVLSDNMPFFLRHFKIPFEGYIVHVFTTGIRVAYIALMRRGTDKIVGQLDVLSGTGASGEMARFILRCPFWNI